MLHGHIRPDSHACPAQQKTFAFYGNFCTAYAWRTENNGMLKCYTYMPFGPYNVPPSYSMLTFMQVGMPVCHFSKLILTRNSCKPQLQRPAAGRFLSSVWKWQKNPSKKLNFSCSKFLRISPISIFLHSEFHQILQLESSAKVVQNSRESFKMFRNFLDTLHCAPLFKNFLEPSGSEGSFAPFQIRLLSSWLFGIQS